MAEGTRQLWTEAFAKRRFHSAALVRDGVPQGNIGFRVFLVDTLRPSANSKYSPFRDPERTKLEPVQGERAFGREGEQAHAQIG